MFGARGVGKSSLVKTLFLSQSNILEVDLLRSEWEDELLKNPDYLIHTIEKMPKLPEWILIDEVQKIPKLLDTVHHLIESKKIKFALTGSSARKLKRGAANLLAGRALSYELFPLTHLELKENFNLQNYLSFGGLPAITHFKETELIQNYLRSYVTTYLKEEIQAEQLVRNLKPFRLFLEVAAQMNAKILNYSKIAVDIGVDTKTVQNYFEILQDTHLGILLQANHDSFRKRQKMNPKFYYFDTGAVRALNRNIGINLVKGTYEYGALFEQFIILEMHRLNSYFSLDYRFSYLQTHNELEVDIVIERPAMPMAFVEIKSSESVTLEDVRGLISLKKDNPQHHYFCLSNDPYERIENGIQFLTWSTGLQEIGFKN